MKEMTDLKFYYCKVCGNVAVLAAEGEGKLVCCEEEMTVLEAGTTDAAQEKHVPEVTVEDGVAKVVVGSVEHPMTEEHYIQFIALAQGENVQITKLCPEDAPKAEFKVCEGPITVYEFCNLHGLWKTEA